ncbi:MAG: TIGR01777 family oxidoreductase, partial [Lentisphaeria bacterium]
RWTTARKARIKDSRVVGTRLLANAMATAANPPQHWICASAIGYYGNRGDEPLTENSSAGDGFLARLCVEWEAAAAPAVAAGIRVAFPRIGIVLSNRGGALAKMLLPFKLCLGGHLGNGRQYMSWISLHDLARALQFLLVTESISGPVNLSAPNPTTNREFTKAMGRALGRPTPFPAPAAILRLLLGEMAEQLLLNSARAIPGTLVDNGFQFDHETLDEALAATLAPH